MDINIDKEIDRVELETIILAFDKKNLVYDTGTTKLLKHQAVEHLAKIYNIQIDFNIVSVDWKMRCCLIKATATNQTGNKFITTGEAHPDNNGFEFFVAVAEKRAIDRAILKALGLHGEYYSWEEFDHRSANQKKETKDDAIDLHDEIVKKIDKQKDLKSFVKELKKYQKYFDSLKTKDEGKWHEAMTLLKKRRTKLGG